jgi:DNA topoisomerase VI subunit A
MENINQLIIGDLKSVTGKWTKQRKAEERRKNARLRRDSYFVRRVYATDVLRETIPPAYQKASDGGTLPARPRQIFYAARGPIMDRTGNENLDGQYFSQKLLVQFMRENPKLTSDWDVVWDARGHLWEPHTGEEVGLGTIEVRDYLAGAEGSAYRPRSRHWSFPTQGPDNRYGAVLFVEKEGFMPLFQKVKLADKWDIAIMSTKGMSVVAARHLVDEVCGTRGLPFLVLHDLDKSGFSILGTLRRSTDRYRFRHRVRVIDLGLRLADARKHGLESEDVAVTDNDAFRDNLKLNGATGEEIDFLAAGQRVELNAFTSRELVNWIEAKLKQHGIAKVVPGESTLADAFAQAYVRRSVNREVARLRERAEAAANTALGDAGDLAKRVKAYLKKDPKDSWDDAIHAIAAGALADGPGSA